MTNSAKPNLNIAKAARFYIRGYLRQSPWAWTTFVLWGLGRVFSANAMLPALIVSKVINNISGGDFIASDQYKLITLVALSIAFGELLIRLWGHFAAYYQVAQADQILKDSYQNLLSRSMDFHANNFAGSLTTKINRLAKGSIDFNDTLHFNVVETIIVTIFMMLTTGRNYPLLSLIGVLGLVLYVIIAKPFISKRMKLVAKRSILESGRTGYFVDGITNAAAIKAYAKESYELKRFSKQVDEAGQMTVKTWLYNNWRLDPISVLFYIGLSLIPLVVVVGQASQGAEVGELFLAYSVFGFLASKVWEIASTWRKIEGQLTEGAEALSILNQPVEIIDAPSAAKIKVKDGQIEFKNANFAYEGVQVFNDFNLDIKPAQTIGLVGPSGGGKSTLVKLIMRFMDLDSGQIAIDGQDISKVTQGSLRRQISYIPQDPVLFHRSIFDNIAYGANHEATHKEVVAAAKKAHVDEFVAGLPNGYDTLVGERGVKLSGGQRQRVAIARAFLKDSPILVLDEATSALDSESEKLIQDSLLKLMKGRTVLAIAHRLSTITHLDRILVIENGMITQDGNHRELKSTQGIYRRLWSHQSDGFLNE